MDPFEDRIRTSLRERAADVEPTPHLYREVQHRITRRRQRRALVLVPAGLAIVAAVAVPLVLSGGPQVPTIADLADRPGAVGAGGAAELVVVDAAGAPAVLDLATGERTPLGDGGQPGEVTGDVEVRLAPGARDVPPRPVVRTSSADGAAEEGVERTVVHVDGERLEVPTTTAGPTEVVPAGGMVVSPDGAWVASLVQGEDADGWAVQLSQIPAAAGEVLETVELTLVLPGGSRLQDWTATDPDGGASRLAVRDPDGRILHLPLTVAADGVPVWEDEVVEVAVDGPVAAYADDHAGGWVTLADGRLTHVQPVDDDRPGAGAITLDEGRVVTSVDVVDGEVRTEVDVTALTDGADRVALRALGTTAVLTTHAGTWWLERGEDGWRAPVRLESGAADAVPVGRDLAPAETPGAPEDGPAGPDAPAPGGPSEDEVGALLGDGLVVADDRALTLLAADGTRRDLVTLSAEGESAIEDVAVRPGGTAEEFTVAFTTPAEGFTDLRYLTVTDGQAGPVEVVDAPPLAPASATDADVIVGGLAWLPDGSRLQWLEKDRSGDGHGLVSIAWSDDGPGGSDERNDDARFGVATLDGTAARLVDAVTVAPDTTRLRFVEAGGGLARWEWDLVVQADGAPSFAAEPRVIPTDAALLAIAGADPDGEPTAELRLDGDGVVVVAAWGTVMPPEDATGSSSPQVGPAALHPLGDGFVVLAGGQLSAVGPSSVAGLDGGVLAVAPVR